MVDEGSRGPSPCDVIGGFWGSPGTKDDVTGYAVPALAVVVGLSVDVRYTGPLTLLWYRSSPLGDSARLYIVISAGTSVH